MSPELETMFAELSSRVGQDDFIDAAYDLTERLAETDTSEAIEPILKLMETHPEADFGNPGPIVHFVERYHRRGYEQKLLESIGRRPTRHTLWMLNRLINGSEGDVKKSLLSTLDVVARALEVDEDVRELARHFRSLHEDG